MVLLTEEEVSKIANNATKDENTQLDGYELGCKSEEIIGYLGKHLTLTINLLSENGKTQRKFFVKTYETKHKSDDYLGETGIFKREQDFYRIVIEDMKEYLGKPDWCPEYYFSKEKVLVLEDLSEEGFKMVDKKQGLWALDVEHLETVLKALTSMHVMSMLLEHQESKLLPAIYPTVLRREILYDENKPEAPTRKWINWQILDLLEGIEFLDKYSEVEKKIIKNNFKEQIMRIYPLSKISNKYRNVLNHGDMWKNNLLFRYNEENFPQKCKFVDFQFIRYAPPAHDVMHLLYYAMKKETRDRMKFHFLNFYYENLKKRMEDHGLSVEKEMSKEEFIKTCEEYKELALIQCLLSMHYLLGPVTLTEADSESYEKYENYLANHRKKYMSKFFREDSYTDKVKDLFYELIDTYLIHK